MYERRGHRSQLDRSELAHANVDVALPVRTDIKVDLIAFVDGPGFMARPTERGYFRHRRLRVLRS